MRKIFTCILSFVMPACMLTTANTAQAQTVTTIESGAYYTALARDKSDNLYGTRYDGGTNMYELVKYTDGTGTATVIYGGLDFDAADYPWGVAVASNGDIYLAAANPDNKIILLTYNSGTNTYSPSDFKAGSFCTNLALDKDDNLYTLEYMNATSDYAVMKYPAGSTTAEGTGTQLFHGLVSAASYPTGLAVADNGDIYVTDGFDSQVSNFGAVYKITAASGYDFSLKTTISSGRYSTSLALDPAGNLFVSEYDGSSTFILNEYVNGTGAPVKIQDLLYAPGLFYPWGIVAFNDKDIYFSNGDDGSGGALLHLLALPDQQASNVTFSNVASTGATVGWTNGSGRARTVFMANATTGSPMPANADTYAANTGFGSGTQIGSSGWYCIYNGTDTSVDVTGLTAGETYRIMAIDYNGAAGEEQYFTAAATNNPMNITLAGALPVSWLSFTVTKQQNTITWTWQLATEENVKSYTPQYSPDGQHYIDAGNVTMLNTNHKYSFVAPLSISGTASFRVKVTDQDGTVRYSEVRTLNTADNKIISVYPNPTTDLVYIQNTDAKATAAQVSITDTRGRNVSRQQVTAANDHFTVRLSGLTTGIYFITLKDNRGHSYTSGPIIKK